LEDLDSAESETASSAIERQVEESLHFFFGNPESSPKCRDPPGDVEMQVELWTSMEFMAHGGIDARITTTVISIVSIPASEASCKWSLSRQKRIMGHFSSKSSPDLLRARPLLASGTLQ
jgi:hypothetical protein